MREREREREIDTYIHTYLDIDIYIYRERERERESAPGVGHRSNYKHFNSALCFKYNMGFKYRFCCLNIGWCNC